MDTTTPFLDTVNSTPRKLGHNKLQIEIQELKEEMELLRTSIVQKEDSIITLNSTIENLQLQLQAKEQEILELKESINSNKDASHLDELKGTYQELQYKYKQCMHTHETLISNINEMQKVIESHMRTILELKNNVEQLQATNMFLKNEIDKKTQGVDKSNENVQLLEQELISKQNIIEMQKSQLETLSQELGVFKTEFEKRVETEIEKRVETEKQVLFTNETDVVPIKRKNLRGEPKKRR